MNTDGMRKMLCETAASLHARGYLHGTTGNLSVRLDDGHVLITPTDACLGRLDPDGLALIDPMGVHVAGAPASKTLSLHRRIYACRPELRCVLHSHSHHLVQLSLNGVWSEDSVLPPLTPYQVMKVGPIPRVSYRPPGDAAVVTLVEQLLERLPGVRGVLLDRLGPVVWHRGLGQASALLEELEASARLWLGSDGRAAPLSGGEVDALCRLYGVHWPAHSHILGTAADT